MTIPRLFGLSNHRMQLSSAEKGKVLFVNVTFEICIRYPSGVAEQAIQLQEVKVQKTYFQVGYKNLGDVHTEIILKTMKWNEITKGVSADRIETTFQD